MRFNKENNSTDVSRNFNNEKQTSSSPYSKNKELITKTDKISDYRESNVFNSRKKNFHIKKNENEDLDNLDDLNGRNNKLKDFLNQIKREDNHFYKKSLYERGDFSCFSKKI